VSPSFTIFGRGALGLAASSEWGPSMLWKYAVRGVLVILDSLAAERP
jgi:hypothetical protein